MASFGSTLIVCFSHCRSQSSALFKFCGRLTRWGRLSDGILLFFLVHGCPLLCGIIYLGKVGEVDVSEPDDSISEHEKLVSLFTYGLSGAGVAVLLGEEG